MIDWANWLAVRPRLAARLDSKMWELNNGRLAMVAAAVMVWPDTAPPDCLLLVHMHTTAAALLVAAVLQGRTRCSLSLFSST